MSLQQVHDFELRLLDPCLAMSKRGIRIDDKLRRERIKLLSQSIKPLVAEVQEKVKPYLADDIPRVKLFIDKWTCPCCKNGSKLKRQCWRCAGFLKAPTKKKLRELQDRYLKADPFNVDVFTPKAPRAFLQPCEKCSGEGQRITKRFNLASHEQMKIVLYHLLKLPKRMKDEKLSTDEDALKANLAVDKSGVVAALLRVGKASTMIKIYTRLEPAEDGRVHTFYNPASTTSGRLNSSGGDPYPKKATDRFALIKSTQLHNMPKKEAGSVWSV